MKRIKLTQGKFALVDDADYEWLNQFKWSAHKKNSTYYACRGYGGRKNRKHITMHQMIMKTPFGKITNHLDRNGLNNQRNNLRISTEQQGRISTKSPNRKSTSKYLGVSRFYMQKKYKLKNGKVVTYKRYQYWLAKLKRNYLGIYKDEEDAAMAYNKEAKKQYGKLAVLNKI